MTESWHVLATAVVQSTLHCSKLCYFPVLTILSKIMQHFSETQENTQNSTSRQINPLTSAFRKVVQKACPEQQTKRLLTVSVCPLVFAWGKINDDCPQPLKRSEQGTYWDCDHTWFWQIRAMMSMMGRLNPSMGASGWSEGSAHTHWKRCRCNNYRQYHLPHHRGCICRDVAGEPKQQNSIELMT